MRVGRGQAQHHSTQLPDLQPDSVSCASRHSKPGSPLLRSSLEWPPNTQQEDQFHVELGAQPLGQQVADGGEALTAKLHMLVAVTIS